MLKNKKNNKGFSLIEMLVVVAIFFILTSVTVFNYNSFDNNITITNLAYEIALSIRESQVLSLGVRGVGGEFNIRYGVYFNTTEDSQKFITFADRPITSNSPNGQCDYDTDTSCSFNNCTDQSAECLRITSLTRNIDVKRICVSEDASFPMDENGECESHGTPSTEVAITFSRPNPDAIIHSYDGTGGLYTDAAILLESPNGARRIINIGANGQVSIDFLNN